MNENVPLTLFTSVNNISVYGLFDDEVSPWNNYPYQWNVDISVKSQSHSDPFTTRPFVYNGLDINIGNWLIFPNSMAVQIIAIISQTDSNLSVIVEDVGLYNLLNNPALDGQGIGNISPTNDFNCIVVSNNSDGVPIFSYLNDYSIPINLINTVSNRFSFKNPTQDYILKYQNPNNFAVGDIIYLDANGQYHKSASVNEESTRSVGSVTSINQPKDGYFTFRPIGRYVKNLPNLPGLLGERLYVSNVAGQLSNTVPFGNSIPVYIKITYNSAIFAATSGASSSGTGNLVITGNSIYSTGTNDDINLFPDGVGQVNVSSIINSNNNRIINLSDPIDNNDAATKSYVLAVAQGLQPKKSVYCATIEDLDATFTSSFQNGALTSNQYSSFVLDGILVPLNSRVLVKNQLNEIENGIYVLIQQGGVSVPWILTRATDFNGIPPAGTVNSNDFVFVEEGIVNADTGWILTSSNPISINITPLIWTQFSSAGVVQAGFGLTKYGTLLSVNSQDLIDVSGGLSTVSSGNNSLISVAVDTSTALEIHNNKLRINPIIAGTGLNISNSTGQLSISNVQTSIDTLGNIQAGTWNGNPISISKGGTGQTIVGPSNSVLSSTASTTEWSYRVQYYEGVTPPSSAIDGDKWYNIISGVLFTKITDLTGSHWVEL